VPRRRCEYPKTATGGVQSLGLVSPVIQVSQGELWRGFASLVLGTFFVRGVGFGATIVLSRAVGPADFGIFAFGLTLAQLFAVCANCGLDDLLVREIARAPQAMRTLTGAQLGLRASTLPIAAGGALLLAVLNPAHSLLYAWFALYAWLHAGLLVLCAAGRGLKRPRDHALLLSLQIVLIAPASIAASILARSIDLAAAAFAAGTALTLALGYGRLWRRREAPSLAWQPRAWQPLVRATLPFGASLFGLLMLDRLAFTSVAFMQGALAAGWFGAAYNLGLALSSVAMAAAATLYPVLSVMARQHPADFAATARRLAQSTLLGSLALAVAVRLCAPQLVPLLFGPAYAPSAPVLELTIWALPLLSLSLVLVTILQAADRQRDAAIATGQALLLAVPLTIIGALAGGLHGAAVSYVVSHLVLTASLLWQAARLVRVHRLGTLLRRPADA
jgi:O-antigen/teichoic acid export membrane protein